MKLITFFCLSAIYLAVAVGVQAAVPSDAEVRQLVDEICLDLAKDVQATFDKVDTMGKYKPHKNAVTTIYEMDGTIAASPHASAIRKNFVKTPDARGHFYRKEMIELAAKVGVGTIEYADRDPINPNGPIQGRVLYFKVARGSDGVSYIVAFIKPKPVAAVVPAAK